MLVYHWVAEYMDGTKFGQFNSDGSENLFRDIDLKRLKRFGWYPFSVELAAKVCVAAEARDLPEYVVDVAPGEELVAYREVALSFTWAMQKGRSEKIVYVLGVEGRKLLAIDEFGRCEQR